MVAGTKYFGTNGIRFRPNIDYGLDFVVTIAKAIGTFFDLNSGPVILGRDGRTSGNYLMLAVQAGLMETGVDAVDAGVVPTPALQFGARTMQCCGGVMITASHNPPEWNGIKVMGKDGVEISRLDEKKIEEIHKSKKFRKADWRTPGQGASEGRVLQNYIEGVLKQVAVEKIRKRSIRIVIDPGNGPQALAAPYIAEKLGCKILTINGELDGMFPGRGGEPTPNNLTTLSHTVRDFHADLGVAYDGDGDRSIFCDDNGVVHWGDISAGVLLDYLLSKRTGQTVVTTVSASQRTEIIAEKSRAKVVRTRVGSVDVSRAMIERNAFFGFEENGGCLYGPHIPVRDGGMTTALMLEVISSSRKPLSSLVASLPKFYQVKTKFECDKRTVDRVMSGLKEEGSGRVDETDGLKIWVNETTWVLIRPSGTEPLIRLFAESDSERVLSDVVRRYSALVAKLVKE